LSYNITKSKLSIGAFDFYFSLNELNGAITKINNIEVESGIKPSLNATIVVKMKRLVLYGQNEKYIEFTLWE
jgi:hypothetical protein